MTGRPKTASHFSAPCSGTAAGHEAVQAGVAELVDALDLGSSDESCGGSSPSARTKRFQRLPTNLGEPCFLPGIFPAGFGFAELTGAGRKTPRRPTLTRFWPSGRTKRKE